MLRVAGIATGEWHSELSKVAVGFVVSLPRGCAGGAAGARAGEGSSAVGKHILESGGVSGPPGLWGVTAGSAPWTQGLLSFLHAEPALAGRGSLQIS